MALDILYILLHSNMTLDTLNILLYSNSLHFTTFQYGLGYFLNFTAFEYGFGYSLHFTIFNMALDNLNNLLHSNMALDTLNCVSCEAWSTHRDYASGVVVVSVRIVTLLVSDRNLQFLNQLSIFLLKFCLRKRYNKYKPYHT